MADSPLREGRDYVIEPTGLLVFTAEYLLRRGHCCKSGCRNCPYGFTAPRVGTRDAEPDEADRGGASDRPPDRDP